MCESYVAKPSGTCVYYAQGGQERSPDSRGPLGAASDARNDGHETTMAQIVQKVAILMSTGRPVFDISIVNNRAEDCIHSTRQRGSVQCQRIGPRTGGPTRWRITIGREEARWEASKTLVESLT